MLRKPNFEINQRDSTMIGQLKSKLSDTIWVNTYKVKLVKRVNELHEEMLFYLEEAYKTGKEFSYTDEMKKALEEEELWL
jgi:hypothetical protein